jgi:ribonucleoside-diphosphate reductase alpha chain
VELKRGEQEKMPDERRAVTHKFSVAGTEGYFTVGFYPDGRPGEIFIVIAKEGSTLSGFADALATMISTTLQFGAPVNKVIEKLMHVRFEPHGDTKNPDIPRANSLVDYIARWLAHKFLAPEERPPELPAINGLHGD